MARHTGNKSANSGGAGGGKIRLLWIDADLGGTDDVAQVTQAIVAALRPPAIQQHPRLIAAATPTMNGLNGNATNGAEEVVVDDVEDDAASGDDGSNVSSAPKSTKPRKVKDPKILDDLDLVGTDVSFADFAKQKNPKNHEKRFLTVLAWFKMYGGKPAVGIDEVYTAYRSKGVNWPYGIAEYDAVFRGLLKRDVVKRVAKGGPYSITVAGESELDTDTE